MDLYNRERKDYAKFFAEGNYNNRRLMFYSEKSGFYKYYENIIEKILENSDLVIAYVTSDPHDQVFAMKNNRIQPYYINKNLITFMMKLDCDMVVMTMPDLEKFHIKRSYIKKDIEYVYVFHYPLSTHIGLRTGALNHYDTIFLVGKFQVEEIRQTENIYGLPSKKLIECGYGVLEKMQEQYTSYLENRERYNDKTKILIAPSWQEDNILDSCLDELLSNILGKEYNIIVRPHPEYLKRYEKKMLDIVDKYKKYNEEQLKFELDFSSTESIYSADIIITDWSGIAYEFSFITKKPALFINTKPKINNPEYQKISVEPLEISLRERIGKSINPEQIHNVVATIEYLQANGCKYKEDIENIFHETISNFGSSGEISANYIIERMKKRSV